MESVREGQRTEGIRTSPRNFLGTSHGYSVTLCPGTCQSWGLFPPLFFHLFLSSPLPSLALSTPSLSLFFHTYLLLLLTPYQYLKAEWQDQKSVITPPAPPNPYPLLIHLPSTTKLHSDRELHTGKCIPAVIQMTDGDSEGSLWGTITWSSPCFIGPDESRYLPCTVRLWLNPASHFSQQSNFPVAWLAPSGEDIRGDSSCFPALPTTCLPEPDMIVSLGIVQRCQQGTEAAHAAAIY